MPRTIEQQRAASAWKAINGDGDTQPPIDDGLLKKYEPLLQGLPVAIHTAGLGQTLAFYLAKGKPEHMLAMEHLAAWLLRPLRSEEPDYTMGPARLMEVVQAEDSYKYRRSTAAALAYLAWLKRFAAARKDRLADLAPAP